MLELGDYFVQAVMPGKAFLALLKSNECHDPQTGQFCETGGEKKKSEHPGGVKGHVAELLHSGQAYSIAELAQATGATPERVKFLLSRLQNPMYNAKGKPALVIQKEGDKYRVVDTKPAYTAQEKAALKVKTEQAPVGTNAIGAHSFTGTDEKGQFAKNNELVGKMIDQGTHIGDGSKSAGDIKNEVATRLSHDLLDDKNWMAAAEKYVSPVGKETPEKLSYELANQIIHGWACTSGDQDARAKAMQLAARDEFNLKDAALAHLGIKTPDDESRVWNLAAKQMGYPGMEGADHRVSPEHIEEFKGAMRAFTRAEYENTQAWFKEKGITEVSVFRGVKQSQDQYAKASVTKLHGQPLSSFSTSLHKSSQFGSRIYMATFPVSHVVGSCRTGRGCLHEHEVVVLGHPIKCIRVGRNRFSHGIEKVGKEAFGP